LKGLRGKKLEIHDHKRHVIIHFEEDSSGIHSWKMHDKTYSTTIFLKMYYYVFYYVFHVIIAHIVGRCMMKRDAW